MAAGVALDTAAPADVGGADNKADTTGVVDVAVVMIDDVTIVDRTDTGAAVDDGSVDTVVIVAKNRKRGAKQNELNQNCVFKKKLARYQRYLYPCFFKIKGTAPVLRLDVSMMLVRMDVLGIA